VLENKPKEQENRDREDERVFILFSSHKISIVM